MSFNWQKLPQLWINIHFLMENIRRNLQMFGEN